MGILSELGNYTGIKSPLDILRFLIDIGIVSFIIYNLILLIRETRAVQLIKGIIAILLLRYASQLLNLTTINYVLTYSIQLIGFALVVLFQPELRNTLERIGRSKFKNFFSPAEENVQIKTSSLIEEISTAATEMARSFTGCLIVLERETGLKEFINKGVHMDAVVSSELLINIFTPNTPLHDGAVIISEYKIKAAACILPLTDNPNLNKELGTRHRAALGITEVSDCIAVIVSEESGKISTAINGTITRNLTGETLRKILNDNLLPDNRKLPLWKGKNRDV